MPLLREREFRSWYLSRSLSVAGTAASAFALPVLVYQTTRSPGLTAAIVGLEALPYLLLGLFAGAAADRMRRKAMMVGSDIGCALLLATIPVAHAFDALTSCHLLVVALGLGVGFCWFDAAAWGALVSLVGRERLPEANSLSWSTAIVLQIAVPAGAGGLASLTHPVVVLSLDAATYLASAMLLARLQLGAPAVAGQNSVLAEIKVGLRYLWRQPVIRSLSLGGFGLSTAGGGAVGLLVVHAHEAMGMPTDDGRIGLLFAAGAVGSLIGAMSLSKLGRGLGPGPESMLAYAVFAGALIGFATVKALGVAIAIWLGCEFAMIVATTNGITIRQQLTPDDLQGRVNTTGRMIAWGGTPFGAVIGGVIAEFHGTRVAYLVLAVPAILGLILLTRSPVWRLRVMPKTTT